MGRNGAVNKDEEQVAHCHFNSPAGSSCGVGEDLHGVCTSAYLVGASGSELQWARWVDRTCRRLEISGLPVDGWVERVRL